MNNQLELVLQNLTQADVDGFTNLLKERGWSTRKELMDILQKSERDVRALAEAAGTDVVRGPKGFNHFDNAHLDEIDHAARIFESQGNKMLSYAVKLRARAHARLGTHSASVSSS